MKSIQFGHTSLLFSFLLAWLVTQFGLAQEQQKAPATPSGAPTGTYAAYVDPHKRVLRQTPIFTLRLETNGTYFAQSGHRVPTQDGDVVRLLPEIARGTWRWDADNWEFRLQPGDFVFYIKCLPVDKQHTNRLVWGQSWLVREENK